MTTIPGPRPSDAETVASFWAWWATERIRIHTAIEQGRPDPWRDLPTRIARLHPQLTFRVRPGLTAYHSLTLEASGNVAALRIARSWLESAPRRDGIWEFGVSDRPSPRPQGSIGTPPQSGFLGLALRLARHPWRLVGPPLLIALAAVVGAIAVPSMAEPAALLVMLAFGIGGLLSSAYLLASLYITFRSNPVHGLIWLVLEGWRTLALLGISLLFLFAVAFYLTIR